MISSSCSTRGIRSDVFSSRGIQSDVECECVCYEDGVKNLFGLKQNDLDP